MCAYIWETCLWVSTEKSTVPFDFRVECSEKERRNTDSFQTSSAWTEASTGANIQYQHGAETHSNIVAVLSFIKSAHEEK